ncbi:hypothetical protein FACS1894105_09910 [Clostridia bacterium]|nr:hypothetical protein FACS1894105_09910 [Clostridia bacterium]
MIKKQILIIGICAIAITALAIVLFVVLPPILAEWNFIEKTEIKLIAAGTFERRDAETFGADVTEGGITETLGTSDRIMIAPQVTRERVKNIVVKNNLGTYKLIHHLGNDVYYFEGSELTPINPETIAGLFTNTGYLLAMTRVAAKDIDDGNEILADLTVFGLDEASDPTYFIVTDVNNTVYKIYIGNKIPTTGGYYVMFEDKSGLRPAIYILDTTMETDVLATSYSLMLPIVAEPIPQNEYIFIDNFKMWKGGEQFLEIYNAPIPAGSEVLVNHQMTFPAPYTVSDKYTEATSAFVNLTGIRVVDTFTPEEDETGLTDEMLVKYGFDQMSCKVSFTHNNKEFLFYFSKLNEAGNYYVVSMDFMSIVEISPETVPFVSWDLLKFIEKPIFSQNINDVAEIAIKYPEGSGRENVTFSLVGTGQTIEIRGNGKLLETQNFRQYYKAILSINLFDYETWRPAESDTPMVTMTITMDSGYVYDYVFYFAATRRGFFNFNGSGEFYTQRERVLKLMTDTDLVLRNEPVDADSPE